MTYGQIAFLNDRFGWRGKLADSHELLLGKVNKQNGAKEAAAETGSICLDGRFLGGVAQ